jgi:hypothetical protein
MKHSFRRYAVVAACAVPLAFGAPASAQQPPVVPTPTPSVVRVSPRKWDLHRINHIRKERQEHRLHIGRHLNHRAQKWAEFVAAHPEIKDKDDPGGAKVCFRHGGHHFGANAAWGFPTVQEAQFGLEASRPHHRNMVHHGSRWVGIGIAKSADGTVVLIQDFCGK